jgi:hypothetical protein
MFVPFWLFIILSGFGCYGALVFINAIRNRKSKAVSPSASYNSVRNASCPSCKSDNVHLSCNMCNEQWGCTVLTPTDTDNQQIVQALAIMKREADSFAYQGDRLKFMSYIKQIEIRIARNKPSLGVLI